jgi:hypothetical protein
MTIMVARASGFKRRRIERRPPLRANLCNPTQPHINVTLGSFDRQENEVGK